MTPKGAQGKRTAGIGVQFSEQDRGNTQKKIENYLAGALGGDKPTYIDLTAVRRPCGCGSGSVAVETVPQHVRLKTALIQYDAAAELRRPVSQHTT